MEKKLICRGRGPRDREGLERARVYALDTMSCGGWRFRGDRIATWGKN